MHAPRRVVCAAVLAAAAHVAAAQQQPALGGLRWETFVGPERSAAGDVDGDGDVDLLFNHAFSLSRISLSRRAADGTFDPPVEVASFGPASAASPRDVSLHDVDGDGDLDLLALPAAVLLNDGGGAFPVSVDIDWEPVLQNPRPGPVGDLDGDGVLDFLLLSVGPPSDPVVFLGNGDGTFTRQPPQPSLTQPLLAPAWLDDLDGDGTLDLLAFGSVAGAQRLFVMNGLGGGQFQPAVEVGAPAAGTLAFSPVVTDVDGDGLTDVVYADGLLNALQVLGGNPDGTFSIRPGAPGLPFAGAFEAILATGDFDGDGAADVVASSFNPGGAWLYRGDGAGGFTLVGEMQPTQWSVGLTVADMDGDGRDDLVPAGYFGSGSAGEFWVLRGAPDAFVDLGFGASAVTLRGSGSTAPGDLFELALDGPTAGPTLLVASLVGAPTALPEGTLVPALGGAVALLPAGGAYADRWPAGVPPGTPVFVQAVTGGALTNALAVVAR